MDTSKKINVADIYPFQSLDEPLYTDVPDNSRPSFSQVEKIDVDRLTDEFMNRTKK